MKKDSLISVLLKIGRYIVNSAAIALLITAILFLYQEFEEQKRADSILNNLQDISSDLVSVQESVSTRYLGIFPDFIPVINEQLRTKAPEDSVVIFEDVLYYGFLSKPEEFTQLNLALLSHSDNGGKISVVYYDINGRVFHRMVQEQRIHSSYFSALDSERRDYFRNTENTGKGQRSPFADTDTLLSRKYFGLTKAKHKAEFNLAVNRYLQNISGIITERDSLSLELEATYSRIDSIKTKALDKNPDSIDFFDYENMYRGISKELIDIYKKHGIEMIAIDENLTMSCWLVKDHAVLAFPSKYASDEIGFFSQDPAFARYIGTILSGLRGYYGAQ